ncbi:Flp pilus assembly protein CpaB [Ornithinimicrobium sufpigmenti]|uniref:Flp pilus assembly protein CpaB n=1 Tax=Ornithinimicrobium sufpigmenti TaxID=2508882 RepID=UPI001035FDBD|nr:MULTISPECIES: RcpC/CpaB family pilus assembly protein [unclassified Ornithinimicrobium]
MIKRVVAAVAALLLAAVGIMLVVNYANRADARALAGQETVDVLVANDQIVQGTPAPEASAALEVRQVPRAYVMQGAVGAVEDLEDRVAALQILPDQQITSAMFVSPDELRRQGAFVLPEEAEDLHQLTINITNPRALGGSIAAGDLVGVFGTFEAKPPAGWSIDADGALVWDDDQARAGAGGPDGEDGAESAESSDDSITVTDLLLDKVLVVRVEGGHLPTAGEEQDGAAADTVHVTLALDPQDAARVIFSMETGSLWLTLAPMDADDAEVRAVVPAMPTRVEGLLE